MATSMRGRIIQIAAFVSLIGVQVRVNNLMNTSQNIEKIRRNENVFIHYERLYLDATVTSSKIPSKLNSLPRIIFQCLLSVPYRPLLLIPKSLCKSSCRHRFLRSFPRRQYFMFSPSPKLIVPRKTSNNDGSTSAPAEFRNGPITYHGR